jgi:hypothetical protein
MAAGSGWRGVLTTGDLVRILASFVFLNIFLYALVPGEVVVWLAANLVLLLCLLLFVNIRASDGDGP